jgi:hypothetical protein
MRLGHCDELGHARRVAHWHGLKDRLFDLNTNGGDCCRDQMWKGQIRTDGVPYQMAAPDKCDPQHSWHPGHGRPRIHS